MPDVEEDRAPRYGRGVGDIAKSSEQLPISVMLVCPRPMEVASLRQTALQCGLAVTCVPNIDGQLPALAGPGATLTGEDPTSVDEGFDAVLMVVDTSDRSATEQVSYAATVCEPIPVLAVIGGDATGKDRSLLLSAGAAETIQSDCTAQELGMRVRNVVYSTSYAEFRRDSVQRHEEEVRSYIGEIVLREYEALYVLGKAAEYKDEDTGRHIRRVAHYSRLIARMIGETETVQETLFHASALHDVGKMGVPEKILRKPGRLDAEEFEVIKGHTTIGHGMLEAARTSFLLSGAMIALTHHEHFNGNGYPLGIKGTDIPLMGRIVGIADVFDALTTRRPYKAPWSLGDAFELLRSERGKQFDPMLVDAFVYNEPRVREIFDDHRETFHGDFLISANDA